MSRIPLVVALAVSGCALVPPPGERGLADGYPVERVRFEGAPDLDEGALAGGLANRPPEFVFFRWTEDEWLLFRRVYNRYDELETELDRRRIRSYFEREGYFSAEVRGPKLERVGGDADRLEVTWEVSPGQPTKVERLYVLGAPESLEPTLRALTELEPGVIYRSERFDAAKLRLRAKLVRAGYARAEVAGRVQIDRARAEAKVVFELDAGPQVRMGELHPVGMVRTPTSAVLGRQTWTEGDVFDPARLEKLRGRLYAIDQYAGVSLDYDGELDGDTAAILARVEEAEQNELQLGLGGGFDTTNIYVRARARYKRRNFPLNLTNSYVEVIPALQSLRETRDGSFFDPVLTPQARLGVIWYDFLIPMLELDSSVGYEFQRLEAYAWQGPDVGQTLALPIFDDQVKVSLGWQFRQYAYEDFRVNSEVQQELLLGERQAVVSVLPSLGYDGRDDPLNPTRGWYLRASLDLGVATGEDAAGFLLFHPEVRTYLPLFSDRLVIAARVNLVTNLQGRLPAPMRLFGGGASSQRGFPQRRLSQSANLQRLVPIRGGDDVLVPVPDREIPIGDETLLETNLEARVNIAKLFGFWFGVVAFLDGADLARRVQDLRLPELHYAAGLGLRYLTPIGAVRVDYGYRLNRTGAGEFEPCSGFGCGTFHFSLGQAF